MRDVIAACQDFRVIDESADWIVVDKPAPLVVHPTGTCDQPSLLGGLHALLAYEIANGAQLSLVNRLDRETSGLVLVAKNRHAAGEFGRAFAARRVHKEYLAVVHGWPAAEHWLCDAPLRRLGEVGTSPVWVRQCVHPAGRPARTAFRVEQRVEQPAGRFALVRCLPETGRMHQLRAHLEHAGHPLVGDKIYGSDGHPYLTFIAHGWTPELAASLLLPRHALHATRLQLEHDGAPLDWHCPLPADLAAFLASPRQQSPAPAPAPKPERSRFSS